MITFFASLYEWFGLMPLYSSNMGDLLRGWDSTCTDFIATPWYIYIGWLMIIITILMYVLQYHIIDSPKFNKKHHWWIMAFVILIINFLIAFTITFNILQSGDFCQELNLTFSDCVGFGFSNALWSLIFFVLITSFPFPRKIDIGVGNCRHTTFWNP